MGITHFRCPECEAALKLARALEPGKRIKCPKCGAVVTVPASEEERQPEPAPTAVRKPAARKPATPPAREEDNDAPAPPRKQTARKAVPPEDDEDAGEQEERPRSRGKASRKPALSPVLLWSLIGGGSAAVVLAVVLVIVLSGGQGGGGGAPKGGGPPRGGGPPKGGEGPKLAEQIVGKWQATPDSRGYRSAEYRKDGTVTLETERIRFDGTYQVVNANTVKHTLTKMDPQVPKSVVQLPLIEDREVYIDGDTLEFGGAAQAKFTRGKGPSGPGPAPGPAPGPLTEEEKRAELDLKNICLAYHNVIADAKRAPANPEEVNPRVGPEIAKKITAGHYTIRWNLPVNTFMRDLETTVVAYESHVPTMGGIVIFGDSRTRKVSPDQFKALVPDGAAQKPPASVSPYRVEILMGKANIEKLGAVRPGDRVKIKGQLATIDTSSKDTVRLHVAEPYSGPEKAVQAADLTRAWAADPAAALKKWREQFPRSELVVEGTLRAVAPGGYLILDGHKP
jgi:hypothetical protein